MKRGAVVIVGSQGRMGALLLRRFRDAGINALGVDQPLTSEALAAVCQNATAAVLCVPAATLRDVVLAVVPHLPETAILVDITSVKERPMETMQALWSGPVVGTHPLFGPTPGEGLELPVAVTPGTGAEEVHTAFVESLFTRMGCRVFRCTPAQHDEAMAAIQGLNFISSLAYFATLAHRDDLLPFLTPSFRRRQEAARKLLTEDASLFEGLFEANPHSHELVRQYRSFLNLAAAGEISLLAGRAAWWWEERNRDMDASPISLDDATKQ